MLAGDIPNPLSLLFHWVEVELKIEHPKAKKEHPNTAVAVTQFPKTKTIVGLSLFTSQRRRILASDWSGGQLISPDSNLGCKANQTAYISLYINAVIFVHSGFHGNRS